MNTALYSQGSNTSVTVIQELNDLFPSNHAVTMAYDIRFEPQMLKHAINAQNLYSEELLNDNLVVAYTVDSEFTKENLEKQRLLEETDGEIIFDSPEMTYESFKYIDKSNWFK